jgi:SAM-dependent methyltransferase
VKLLALESGQHVCDLCCGIGRHSLELAHRGFRVTAVDRTEQYLDEARRQAETAGLEIEFVQDDMRHFCRREAFDAVLNMFTSFGYFDAQADDRRTVENAYRSLKPGGTLLVEVIGKEIVARIFQPRDWQDTSDGIVLYERKVVDDWSRIENRWILVRDGRQHEWGFQHRIYAATELSGLLTDCGFTRVEAYGDLNGAAYDEKAERLVVVGYK